MNVELEEVETESLKADAPETSSTTCSSCLEVFDVEHLYRCSTCNSKSEDEKQANQSNGCCESCITIHIRRKHEVVDNRRGYSLTICDTHKKISVLYCNDCNSVLCHNCVTEHSGHSFQSVDTKSSEVRKNIFEFLNEIEENLKPLKQLETVLEESSKEVGDFRSSLSEEKLIETLKSLYNGVIESNLASWIEIVNKIKEREISEKTDKDVTKISKTDVSIAANSRNSNNDLAKSSADEKLRKPIHSEVFRDHIKEVTEGVDKSMKSLKKMLLMSEGSCITQFNGAKSGVESSIEKCRKELGKHACLEWSAEAEDIIRNSISGALNSFKLCLMQSISVETAEHLQKVPFEAVVTKIASLNLSNSSANHTSGKDYQYLSSVLSASIEKESCRLKVLKDKFGSTLLETVHFPSEVSFALKEIENKSTVALHTKSHLLLFFCLKSHRVIEQRQLEASSIPVGFCQLSNKSFTLDLWNSEEKILLVEKEQIRMESNFRPKFINRSCNRLHIVDSNDNIVIHDTIAKTELHIRHFHHGLSSMDNILIENRQKVLLCDYRIKLVLVCSIS